MAECDDETLMVVVVSHIESPSLFYCRLEMDLERFHQLSQMINEQIVNHQENQYDRMPELSNRQNGRNFVTALAYSSIHQAWCRARVISIKVDTDLKPLFAKVWLLDYGSMEFITWKPSTIQRSTPQIDNYNNGGQGFCFPCSLYNVKPAGNNNGDNDAIFDDGGEWTSYTNYLFKKEAHRGQRFRLKKMPAIRYAEPLSVSQQSLSTAQMLTCDLYPIINSVDENADDPNVGSSDPITCQLVNAKVAQYIDINYLL